MLVLRTSNFQGTTIRPIVQRHKQSIVARDNKIVLRAFACFLFQILHLAFTAFVSKS